LEIKTFCQFLFLDLRISTEKRVCDNDSRHAHGLNWEIHEILFDEKKKECPHIKNGNQSI
jgi:hypothetical protein